VAFWQNKELIGVNGLTPLKLYLARIDPVGDKWWVRLEAAPTLFWFVQDAHVDWWLDFTAAVGMLLSVIVMVLGSSNMLIMFTLWALYHSLVNVGQVWYSFGWESQLLETGFLAIWLVPLVSMDQFPSNLPSPTLCVWGYRWLLFRIMFGAGLIKIRGDACWLDLTCMNYFYETQPVPNPASYYLHHAPLSWHAFETFGNHVIELLLPLLTFLPFRRAWLLNGIFQIVFQGILITTGNLSFLNWLTIAPSIWYFDDKALSMVFPVSTVKRVQVLQVEDRVLKQNKTKRTGTVRFVVSLMVGFLIAYLSRPIVLNLMSRNQVMNTSFDPLRIVNTYGAFGHVTKERFEVVVQGTLDDDPTLRSTAWEEYEFKCKPGNVARTPCLISPYHYRLDWLMWFAGFQQYQNNPWLLHLIGRMMDNDPIVDSLLQTNPFKEREPPKFMRAVHYKYVFTQPGSSDWWNRKLIDEYVPIVRKQDLKPIYKQFGWKF